KRLPFHSQTSSLRSRVTPGVSCTTAARDSVSRLTSVDLPTFGKPTIATVPSSAASVGAPFSSLMPAGVRGRVARCASRRPRCRASSPATSAPGTSPRCRGSGSPAAPRAGGRPCSCPLPRARQWQRSSLCDRLEQLEKPGEAYSDGLRVLDLDTFLRNRARDGPEHRDPVVAARGHCSPSGAGGNTTNPEAIFARRDADAQGPERIRHRFDAVRFLHAPLPCALDDALAARVRAGQGTPGQA